MKLKYLNQKFKFLEYVHLIIQFLLFLKPIHEIFVINNFEMKLFKYHASIVPVISHDYELTSSLS